MSQTSKIVLGIAVLLVLALGAYYYWQQQEASKVPNANEVTTLPTGSNASDSSIEQDLSAIDAQLKAAGDDTTAAHASVNTAAAQ